MTLRVWGGEHIDRGAIEQAERASRCPIMAGPVALMPDAHVGRGSTIGSVIPTEGAIIPAAVGVDIGCGMIAVETSISAEALPDTLDSLAQQFARSIPAGVGRDRNLLSTGESDKRLLLAAHRWISGHPLGLPEDLVRTAVRQLGTLGAGNHFLEVCADEDGAVWVVLHSGSRGIGNKLATKHIGLAKDQHQALEDPDLAYFLAGTKEFNDYIQDMVWAQCYALENRELMMDAALGDLFSYVGFGAEVHRINCHHNFAAREMHDNRLLWITRKGAIRACVGDLGVVPGSMATGSYIVEGLGNEDSYTSCAHGAGRRLSRGQARRELTEASLVEAMRGKAWNGEKAAHALLDESPAAYKDLDQVMEDQADLVRIVHRLTTLVNYKGEDERGRRGKR